MSAGRQCGVHSLLNGWQLWREALNWIKDRGYRRRDMSGCQWGRERELASQESNVFAHSNNKQASAALHGAMFAGVENTRVHYILLRQEVLEFAKHGTTMDMLQVGNIFNHDHLVGVLQHESSSLKQHGGVRVGK